MPMRPVLVAMPKQQKEAVIKLQQDCRLPTFLCLSGLPTFWTLNHLLRREFAGPYAGEVQGNARSVAIRLFMHVYCLERHQTGFGRHVIGLSQGCRRTYHLSALNYSMPPSPRGVGERVQQPRKNNIAFRTYCWRMIRRTAIDLRHHKHPNSMEVTPTRRVRPIDF